MNASFDLKKFQLDLSSIQQEFERLLSLPYASYEVRTLTKFSIQIKQIHYQSKQLCLHPKLRKKAKALERFLETPLAPPFTTKMSLAEAALTFSEQNPYQSDLSAILKEMREAACERDFLRLFSFCSSKNPVGKSKVA